MPKNTFKGHVDLSLIAGEDKIHYVLIKDFNKFMYDHTLHSYCYCSEAFRTTKILKSHVNDCFKVNGEQMIKVTKKKNMLDPKIMKRNQNHCL